MIVVWATFSAPSVLNEKLLKGEFREVYIDLNSASPPRAATSSPIWAPMDWTVGQKDQPADSYDQGTTSVRFTVTGAS
jgi:hypothetical protein